MIIQQRYGRLSLHTRGVWLFQQQLTSWGATGAQNPRLGSLSLSLRMSRASDPMIGGLMPHPTVNTSNSLFTLSGLMMFKNNKQVKEGFLSGLTRKSFTFTQYRPLCMSKSYRHWSKPVSRSHQETARLESKRYKVSNGTKENYEKWTSPNWENEIGSRAPRERRE